MKLGVFSPVFNNRTLEEALEYIEDDELVGVTPQSIRLRKRTLSATQRRKEAKNK